MTDITIIIPVHEWSEKVKELLTKALKSVEKCREQYKDGKLPVLIVAPPLVDKQLTEDNALNIIVDVKSTSNNGNTDFCSQVNNAVELVETDFFSILEYDDTYKPKWFKLCKDYYYGNETISAFLPVNVLHNSGQNWRFGNDFGLSNAFLSADADDNDDLGIINFKRLEGCSMFNLTGAVINRNDFIKVGGFKPSIKVAFNYEFLLRLTSKELKCMVVPKEGYVHDLGREGSLTDTYSKTLTTEEVDKWFELAYREYIHDEDRGKTISNNDKEELK